jgi:hypothetical protein
VIDPFEQECRDVDQLLRHLGLDPSSCRSEGGRLLVGKIIARLEDRGVKIERGRPIPPHASGPATYIERPATALDVVTKKDTR